MAWLGDKRAIGGRMPKASAVNMTTFWDALAVPARWR
jgi:hypothetical protein